MAASNDSSRDVRQTKKYRSLGINHGRTSSQGPLPIPMDSPDGSSTWPPLLHTHAKVRANRPPASWSRNVSSLPSCLRDETMQREIRYTGFLSRKSDMIMPPLCAWAIRHMHQHDQLIAHRADREFRTSLRSHQDELSKIAQGALNPALKSHAGKILIFHSGSLQIVLLYQHCQIVRDASPSHNSVLFNKIALLRIFLCMFANSEEGFMTEYAILTVRSY